MSPDSSTKYLHPTPTPYDMDSDNEAHSDCSPRGSISLATSDDNLLPPRNPVSNATQSVKAVHTRRSTPRTVHFAEQAQLSPAPVYPPLGKSQKAKEVAKTTVKCVGSVSGCILGCICFIFAKACILDGDSGLSGNGSKVVVARAGEEGSAQRNTRMVEKDMRGYGYYGDEKRRVNLPAGVRTAQQGRAGQRTPRSVDVVPVQRSYRAH